MHWAAHGHTASEIIMIRADATKPNMGMTVVSGKKLSRELANKKAELEYEKFKKLTDDGLFEIERHFIEELEEVNKKLKK